MFIGRPKPFGLRGLPRCYRGTWATRACREGSSFLSVRIWFGLIWFDLLILVPWCCCSPDPSAAPIPLFPDAPGAPSPARESSCPRWSASPAFRAFQARFVVFFPPGGAPPRRPGFSKTRMLMSNAQGREADRGYPPPLLHAMNLSENYFFAQRICHRLEWPNMVGGYIREVK